MIDSPVYKSTPTVREYEQYLLENEYTKGWNDAMDFIFPEVKAERERLKSAEKLKVISNK